MSATTCLSTSIPEPAAPAEAAPAEAALIAAGVPYRLVRHRRVGSLAEAAALRGVRAADLIKTIVVRRGEADYLFVLVPGDREIAWPKLRAHLGVNRLSMPDAAKALAVTGYDPAYGARPLRRLIQTAIGDPLAREARILATAQRRLRDGDPDAALVQLRIHATRFAAGALAEERDALIAAALCQRGEVVAGRDAATQLAARAPTSAALATAWVACESAEKDRSQ